MFISSFAIISYGRPVRVMSPWITYRYSTYIADHKRPLPAEERFVEVGQLTPAKSDMKNMKIAGLRIQIHTDPFRLNCWVRIQITVRITDSDVKPEP
jgi:hypothetical protein